jgi:hypothetical protein
MESVSLLIYVSIYLRICLCLYVCLSVCLCTYILYALFIYLSILFIYMLTDVIIPLPSSAKQLFLSHNLPQKILLDCFRIPPFEFRNRERSLSMPPTPQPGGPDPCIYVS